MRLERVLSCVLVASLWSGIGGAEVSAATMRFDHLSGYDDCFYLETVCTYEENGIVVTGSSDFGSWDYPGSIHLDGSGGPYSGGLDFSMNRRFDPISLVVIGMNRYHEIPLIDMIIRAFREDNPIFLTGISVGSETWTYYFPDHLTGVTNIEILALPGEDYEESHFSIDDVTLAPVPVPPASMAIGSAFALLLWAARRRRLPALGRARPGLS
jgi:hypothetical protein